jgi:hypothetical protein
VQVFCEGRETTDGLRIPLFQILEARGFRVFLVNAHHVKNVPGRKSDVSAYILRALHIDEALYGRDNWGINLPKLALAIAFIETMVAADQKAPRKQRHTAHRIWCRIRAEMPEVQVCEPTIRRYVRQRKMELRLVSQERCVPQSYRWGQEGQVDWYEAYVDISEEREKAYVFCMRSMASGGAFHCAFPHASQQAFLEAHELGFAYFGGVFGH